MTTNVLNVLVAREMKCLLKVILKTR